ncbi:DoxX family protein [Shimia marina]|uniref:DoxX n=1 Tax=Shimia marina TaxID=321267 RepID=A0A0P1ESI9_9RHOB|nr:DoxX family protein [Shimia marina]CUH53354.1 DoxX [Shimia marina]SFD79001.1 putative oxidoreductase [Shimia marina]
MTRLISQYTDLLDRLNRLDWLVPTLARLTFVAVLFFYFWNSALLKIDGSIFSPSSGAFGQIFPKAAEAVLWDVTQMSFFQRIVILAGTIAEFVLPVLIVIGLLTRVAAFGMIGFIIVQTIVDVTGHGVALGGFFDSAQGLIDQRAMWVLLFAVLVFKGAGPISVDAIFGKRASE